MILIIVLSAFLLFVLLSHIVYGRTLIATVVEFYLRLTERHYTEKELLEAFDTLSQNGDSPYVLPRSIKKRLEVTEKYYGGMQLFCVNFSKEGDTVVIYLHGGAYYRKPRKYHLRFIEKVSNETKTPFLVPIYKKAPNHCCTEAYPLLASLYSEAKTKYKKVVLAGDSSGGGLALGLALYLKERGIDLPDSLILLSPWVDVSLENTEIQKYIKKDPIVFLDNVKLLGKKWAGELPLSDYRVSPLYGEMSGLPATHIFCGTRELLYPDCVLLYEKIKASGIEVSFYIGKGQNHVYPIFPIPEAKKARKIIDNLIAKI